MKSFRGMACGVLLLAGLSWASQAFAQSAKASGPGSFLSIEGSKIYFEECGTSPQTVVLIHDGVIHSAVWDEVWPEFCEHFHTIRYDRRGYGRSAAATGWYSETDDLAILLRHLKVSRAALVGKATCRSGKRLLMGCDLPPADNLTRREMHRRWERSARHLINTGLPAEKGST
jgi:hypothetical protein